MARVRLLSKSDLPAADADVFERDSNLYAALAHSPDLARAIRALGKAISGKSHIEPRLRELAIVQVSYLAHAPYIYSHHLEIGLRNGVSEADLAAVAGKDEGLDPLARLVLNAAREITTAIVVSDATLAALKAYWDERQLVEFIATVGFYNAMSRFTASLQLDIEAQYLPFLARFPIR
jgi:alkylhydroperoxidase family enzyme